MSQIKQLLQLHEKGESRKQIARILGVSKNTVKGYLQKLYLLKMSIDELLSLEDPELEKKFHGGNPAYKDPRFEYMKQKLDYYEKVLGAWASTENRYGKNTGSYIPQHMGTPSFAII